jgi:ribosomal protein S18 acetylase RimI-like enzyme
VSSLALRAPGELQNTEEAAVWMLLKEVDREFIPPLSSRESTTTKNLQSTAVEAAEPRSYFKRLLGQVTLIASVDGNVAGFMSFIPAHHDLLISSQSPCSYISTIAVARSARRLGIARRLYDGILSLPDRYASPWVVTRTWSTNSGHLNLLESLGFREIVNLPDDRGPGIDTVYYARERSSQEAALRS